MDNINWPLIIGISGKKGSGKSTIANYLEAELDRVQNITTCKMGFADPIRKITFNYFGARWESIYGDTDNRNMPTPCGRTTREIMQKLGAFLRTIDPDFAIRNIETTINEMRTNGTCPMVIIIPDVRYGDEVCWIIQRGGFVLRLTREPVPDRNETEIQLDNIPATEKYLIINNDKLSQEETEVEALRITRKFIGV